MRTVTIKVYEANDTERSLEQLLFFVEDGEEAHVDKEAQELLPGGATLIQSIPNVRIADELYTGHAYSSG